ncbi:hypothetical protein DXZ75_42260 [Streptomyces sp. AcE210]|nr:hypothetical protein DXZ75_42260 [Streptomyces sp. AcE210]
MVLRGGPESLMRGQRAVSQADLAGNNAVAKSRRAERRPCAGRIHAWAESMSDPDPRQLEDRFFQCFQKSASRSRPVRRPRRTDAPPGSVR